jgi:hypothetical protein
MLHVGRGGERRRGPEEPIEEYVDLGKSLIEDQAMLSS